MGTIWFTYNFLGGEWVKMIPLWRETGYRFDFDDARRVERIHLNGANPGDTVGVFRKPFCPASVATVSGVVEVDGWARLDFPLITAPGDQFVALITPMGQNLPNETKETLSLSSQPVSGGNA